MIQYDNHHLNFFRFHEEDKEAKHLIENNLTRAFAICLMHEPTFMFGFLKEVLSQDHFEQSLNYFDKEEKLIIDVQCQTNKMNADLYQHIYAVGLTTTELDFSDFVPIENGNQTTTDLIISIKDFLIIVEVKRNDQNCKWQLGSQVHNLLKGNETNPSISAQSIAWRDILNLLNQVKVLNNLYHHSNHILSSFTDLIEKRYSEWLPVNPFSIIAATDNTSLKKRLSVCLSNSQYEKVNGETLTVDFGWMNKFEFKFNDDNLQMIFYPANTKGQGLWMLSKFEKWKDVDKIHFHGKEYELSTRYHLKMSHINGAYVTGLWYDNPHLKNQAHSIDDFHKISGKWKREQWTEYKTLMDSFFVENYAWEDECEWEDNFENTNRGFAYLSLGFENILKIPMSEIRKMDKNLNDTKAVASFIDGLIGEVKSLMDSL